MRYRGPPIRHWTHGSCCLSRLSLSGSLCGRIRPVRGYSADERPSSSQKTPTPPPPPPAAEASPPAEKSGGEVVKEHAVAALKYAGDVGKQWGQRSAQTASATVNYWWEQYEEFVGINEVRGAQTKVTEAEAAFMVARGMVSEAHAGLEVLQGRLKEVRDRLDRVSREEAHYLELATLEHKLLQEERRHRSAYENAESSERERFAQFSAAVRASHEKERTRAERTKNWSIIGSVLGALIGVMGSTYINRVRLQELKNLLLEAQKGPESLQEALRVQAGIHRSQQDELRAVIDSLRLTLSDASTAKDVAVPTERGPTPDLAAVPLAALKDLHVCSQRTQSALDSLLPRLGDLEKGLDRVESTLSTMKKKVLDAVPKVVELPIPAAVVERVERVERVDPREAAEPVLLRLEETQRTLGERIRTNTHYTAVFTYTAAAITVSAVYLMLRGAAG